MINPKEFYECLLNYNFDFFTGVPDSLLKEFCSCVSDLSKDNHIITANEGNAIAIASGYNISTGHFGVVYMQNSGIGNVINPLLSLADEEVYEIPMLLIIGYRGEPNNKDEPQHVKQGKLTLPILETLGIPYLILGDDYKEQIEYCSNYIKTNKKTIAIVVKKDTFSKYEYKNKNNNLELSREQALDTIISKLSNDDYIVSTTGKTSREIFEIREKYNMNHDHDFLTVGSMGHTSSLALGISLGTNKNVYCIDGDGSFIMHMGALAVTIQNAKSNFKYVLINNGCHESVGGQPTISNSINIEKILEGFGFKNIVVASNIDELTLCLDKIKDCEKCALIINTNDKSRKDLGRPTINPKDNKKSFENSIRS